MPFTNSKDDCARYFPYNCCACERAFHNAAALIKHLKKRCNTHRNVTYRCGICTSSFETKGSYIRHLLEKRHHEYDLHQAACCGQYEDVAKLIHNQSAAERGDSHKATDNAGSTPLHCAAFKGYSECLKIMLSWPGRHPNIKDENGQTPVHIASRFGRTSTLKLLLINGGRLDLADNDGRNPIQLAQNRDDCIQAFFEVGFDMMMKSVEYMNYSVQTRVRRRRHGDGGGAGGSGAGGSSSSFTEGTTSGFEYSTEEEEAEGAYVETEENDRHSSSRETESSSGETEARDVVIAEPATSESDNETNGGPVEDTAKPDTDFDSVELLPYEVIARGKKAVKAFKTAMKEGLAPASRLKLIIVGEVDGGKTSLTRSLSKQPFEDERQETHGIQTSMVTEMLNRTELDLSWELVDARESHLDDILAMVVSDMINNLPESESKAEKVESTEASFSPGEEPGSQTHMSVEDAPLEMPVLKIAKRIADRGLKKKIAPSSMRISMWDFAGHKLYETMHHIFMNDNSLYLVVFNLMEIIKDKEKCVQRIHYWLNSIASHTPESTPVIIVGTRRGLVTQEVINDANELCRQHFGDIFSRHIITKSNGDMVFVVENKAGQEDEGIGLLIHTIKNEASTTLPFVMKQLPLKWFHCEEKILAYQEKSDNTKLLSRNELRKMLEENCEVSFADGEFTEMLSFFHKNGLILVPDIMRDSEVTSSVKDLVVLSPQFLVDAMTRIHDLPVKECCDFKRRFSHELKKLEDEGKAGCGLLNHIFKDLESGDVLVDLLCHFNLLVPLPKDTSDQLEDSTSSTEEFSASAIEDYVIPCMLKKRSKKSVEKRWKKTCNGWKNLSAEVQLVFDFRRFLPQALFDYLLVSITKYSQKTKGIQKSITREAGIFSFSNDYLFKMRLDLKNSQIWFFIRCKEGEQFIDLATDLVNQVQEITSQYFKFLQFYYGPPCPRQGCPGATLDSSGVQRAASSSSDDSSGDNKTAEEQESCTKRPMSATSENRRRHIIQMDVNSFKPPYWCSTVEIEEEFLKDWAVTAKPIPQTLDEDTDGVKELVEQCCLLCVSELLGDSGKDVGRKLGVPEECLENISKDCRSQKEDGHQIVIKWMQKDGAGATVKKISEALAKCGRNDIVEKLQQHREEKHECQ